MNKRAALSLDRMVIEEAGPRPEAIASAIHEQLGLHPGPVPVRAIARALDIIEIKTEPLSNFEGALIAPPERGHGLILVNSASHLRRQNFTIAHELGHYLSVTHVPTTVRGFQCTQDDFRFGSVDLRQGASRHNRQEAEANRFAIELLLRRHLVATFLGRPTSLATVLDVSKSLQISREAAARRYVELHDKPVAILFCTSGRLRYAVTSAECPFVRVRQGDQLPIELGIFAVGTLTGITATDPAL